MKRFIYICCLILLMMFSFVGCKDQTDNKFDDEISMSTLDNTTAITETEDNTSTDVPAETDSAEGETIEPSVTESAESTATSAVSTQKNSSSTPKNTLSVDNSASSTAAQTPSASVASTKNPNKTAVSSETKKPTTKVTATSSANKTARPVATSKPTSTAKVTAKPTVKPTVKVTVKPTVNVTVKPTVKPTATAGTNNVLPANPSEKQVIEYLSLNNVGREISNDAFDEIAKKTGGKTISVKDYGAKGDGVTNDKSAIDKAVDALKSAPAGSVLKFEAYKTYYCGNSGEALKLASISYKKIQGSNTTILIDAPAKYIDMNGCKHFAIQGLNFNYKTKPYAFTKSIDKVTNGSSEYSIEVTLDRSLGISKTYTPSGLEFFGVLNRENGRYHMSINQIQVINANTYKYKIIFNDTTAFHPINDSIKNVQKYGMIVPVPNIGHSVEQAFTILNNTNIAFKDCNVYSACKFMFFIHGNSDKVLFENFDVVPDPAEKNGDIRIVGWRDGFHCKENRAQLIWKDCKLEWVYDDMFNICATMTKITGLSKGSDGTSFDLNAVENNNRYSSVKKGDIVTVYNTGTGKIVGVSKIANIRSVKENGKICRKIYLKDDIEGLKNGLYVSVDSLAAPNSQIINCEIKGTLRFRTPMFIADSKIHVTRMWLAFETAGGKYLEGPVAQNILFSNCKFTFDNSSEKFIEIFNANSASTKALKAGNVNQDEYFHVKNIIFYKSVINTAQIIYKNAEQYCSDVTKFISCTK